MNANRLGKYISLTAAALFFALALTSCNSLYNLMNKRELKVTNTSDEAVSVVLKDSNGKTTYSIPAETTSVLEFVLPFKSFAFDTEVNKDTQNFTMEKVDVLEYKITGVEKVLVKIENKLDTPVTVTSLLNREVSNDETEKILNSAHPSCTFKFPKDNIIRTEKNEETGVETEKYTNPYQIENSYTDFASGKNVIRVVDENVEPPVTKLYYYEISAGVLEGTTVKFVINKSDPPAENP